MNGIKNFFMALTPLFLYRIVNTFCIMFFITYVSPPALNEVETLFVSPSLFSARLSVLYHHAGSFWYLAASDSKI